MASNEEILAGMAGILNEVADGPPSDEANDGPMEAALVGQDSLSLDEVALAPEDADAAPVDSTD
jgi:hypothetical protein